MNRCTRCLEAPVYDGYVSEPTFYYSPVCQKADWGQHKSKCRKLQARKTFDRAALLLQAIIYRIRLHASPSRFKSVRLKRSIISLDGFQDVVALIRGLSPNLRRRAMNRMTERIEPILRITIMYAFSVRKGGYNCSKKQRRRSRNGIGRYGHSSMRR